LPEYDGFAPPPQIQTILLTAEPGDNEFNWSVTEENLALFDSGNYYLLMENSNDQEETRFLMYNKEAELEAVNTINFSISY
jgi:hypothetical protein